MVKKSLIAIAVMCVLTAVTYAQDGNADVGLKFDGDHWPCECEYTSIDFCSIDVYIKIAKFVKIDCPDSLTLKQVDCPLTGSDPNNQHPDLNKFPCFNDCQNLTIKTNFPVKIKCKFTKKDDYGVLGSYKAYFAGGGIPAGTYPDTYQFDGPGSKTIKICMDAWNVNLYKVDPDDHLF